MIVREFVTVKVAVVAGVAAALQTTVGPDSLLPLGAVAGVVSAVATGAAIAAWYLRGTLDKMDGRFGRIEDRLGAIEQKLHDPCSQCPYIQWTDDDDG